MEILTKHQQEGVAWPNISRIMSVHPERFFSCFYKRDVIHIADIMYVYVCLPRE